MMALDSACARCIVVCVTTLCVAAVVAHTPLPREPALDAASKIQIAAARAFRKLERERAASDAAATAHSDDDIEVYLIPHSHCDYGWILTPPEYYEREVRLILDSTTRILAEDTTKTLRFNWAETAWLPMWLADDVNGTKRALLRQLTQDGMLEFIGGGWVQNDEAVSAFDSVINQMTVGHQYLLNEVGIDTAHAPVAGWQIDPFGASAATPRLFAEMGFTTHVIDRIPLRTHLDLMSTQQLEFTWQPTPGVNASIFTHVLDTPFLLYFPPLGFDWEVNNNSLLLSPPVTEANVQLYADLFVDEMRGRRPHWKTNKVMVLFGGDFHYQHASYMFNNMSRVMDVVNANATNGVSVRYSTVSEYFNALPINELPPVFSRVTDPNTDFLPYNMLPNQFWTGFYTSRPVLKGMSRHFDARLRAAEAMFVLARASGAGTGTDWPALFGLLQQGRQASAAMKHHDAMPGTARARVVTWYEQMLANATAAVDNVMAASAAVLTGTGASSTAGESSPFSAASTLHDLQPGVGAVTVVVFNALGVTRTHPACLPCPFDDVAVGDASGAAVLSQTAPNPGSNGRSAPGDTPAPAPYTLCFDAQVPAVGYTTFNIRRPAPGSRSPSHWSSTRSARSWAAGPHVIGNSWMRVELSSDGSLASATNVASNVTVPINHTFGVYSGAGNAYQLLPRQPDATPISPAVSPAQLFVGPVFSQVTQHLPGTRLNHTLRLFSLCQPEQWWQCSAIESHTRVGPLHGDIDFVTKFASNIDNNGTLFTDDSGLHTVRRAASPNNTDTSGSTFPTISFAYVRSSSAQLTLLSSQPHAVASRAGGELEAILHRRMTQWSLFNGLFQALNDTSVLGDTVWVTVDTPQGAVDQMHSQSLLLNSPYQALYSTPRSTPLKVATPQLAPLIEDLPHAVRLLTLQAKSATQKEVVLRFVHMFALHESSVFSKPVDVPLGRLFSSATPLANTTSATPMQLSLIKPTGTPQSPPPPTVSLSPLQIRSFVVS